MFSHARVMVIGVSSDLKRLPKIALKCSLLYTVPTLFDSSCKTVYLR